MHCDRNMGAMKNILNNDIVAIKFTNAFLVNIIKKFPQKNKKNYTNIYFILRVGLLNYRSLF